MRILIIEDDQVIARLLKDYLIQWHYEVEIVTDSDRILDNFQAFEPHLILLDVNLPHYNGYYWCQEIRQLSQLPIIFISSRNEAIDKVLAMQMGGDDFITKPIELPVLVAKIQALLRRSYDFKLYSPLLTYQGLELKATRSQLTYQDQSLNLTKTELQIIQTLIKAQGDWVSREQLIEACWLGQDYIDDNTLAVNIHRLRKKLAQLGLDGLIQTKKGMGYGLASVEDEDESIF
ncbi:response regulator transcription factor [Facklamia hominis]|uniref:Response regulator transcription factor n=1 Tax=Facklamia hominis TaxID=178214 RepID=A0AAJ1V1Y2_9LACT|nr:response regulator transcription factor [Facklamia hominis]MDK7187010.1 response regulator transcription factor [Facklamia hominis]